MNSLHLRFCLINIHGLHNGAHVGWHGDDLSTVQTQLPWFTFWEENNIQPSNPNLLPKVTQRASESVKEGRYDKKHAALNK